MEKIFKTFFERINKHASNGYGATMHGDFVNDAGELEFDIEFQDIDTASTWASMAANSWGVKSEIRDAVTSLTQRVVLTCRVTPELAATVTGQPNEA